MSATPRSASRQGRRRPPQTFARSPGSTRGAADGTEARTASAAQFDGAGRQGRDGVKSSRTGMRLDPSMAIDDWKALGVKIAIYAEATAWWLGDWLAFGQTKYRRRYREGIELTGLEYQTLRNYAMVARRFEPSRRRDNLSFQHHAEVCSLEDDDQDFWLELAAERHWSKRELRRRVRGETGEPTLAEPATTLRLVIGPHRDRCWRQAAEQSDCALEDWVTRTLDAAAGAALDESHSGRPT